jgi:hypothetical protein
MWLTCRLIWLSPGREDSRGVAQSPQSKSRVVGRWTPYSAVQVVLRSDPKASGSTSYERLNYVDGLFADLLDKSTSSAVDPPLKPKAISGRASKRPCISR